MKRTDELLDLSGKVALVTGGSRGIGRAVVEALAGAGADVVVASRKLENCETAAREIAAATGRRALPVACHVGKWEECDRLVETVYAEYGRCDVLVNNAGMSPAYDGLASVSEELYDKVHATNARGPFRLSVLIGERMARGDGGSIVNISSIGSRRPNTVDLPYGMAKAALNALTIGLAGAWAPKVRVNLVLPSATETDMNSGWPAETKARVAESNPMQRLGRPEDVAAACVFLASDAAGYINGAQLAVDGGLYRNL
ncbi:MAG TPA: glucose 1-dehydrogenase [Acidimicrobiales bacterium]|jgi:NAD(P)-dependent dehydrogenase (short-subunit alcohol dehydrogenase family)|nr:glucose 1-dehydrogenase [Acidimicrobiales bacterium]